MIAVFDTNMIIDALNGITAADAEYSHYERVLISRITWMQVLVGARIASACPIRSSGPRPRSIMRYWSRAIPKISTPIGKAFACHTNCKGNPGGRSELLQIPAGFVAFGLLYSFITNSIAGLAGGVVGWLILRALRRAGFFAYLAEKR